MVYHKLVRDRIPELIKQNGEYPHTRILNDEEYRICLEKKLDEEVAEYHRDKNTEELADILEVLYALASIHGSDSQQLQQICDRKRELRGGFQKRIFLVDKE